MTLCRGIEPRSRSVTDWDTDHYTNRNMFRALLPSRAAAWFVLLTITAQR